MHFGMFAFMESICCHGKLEDSNTKLEFAMQMQRKRTWLPDSAFAHVTAKVPISGVSTELLDLLATFSTCLLFLCSAKKCVHRQHPFSDPSTRSTASGENRRFS